MRKPGNAVCGILCFSVGLFALAGCDLLGLGPKKQNNPQPQSQVSLAAPAASATQEMRGPLPSDALVRIGDWTLTEEDFNTRLNLLKQQLSNFNANDPASKNAVLDELIRQELLVKDAEDSGIGDTKEIKNAVSDFRRTLLVQELASRMTKDVVATEDDARAFYDANKPKFAEPVKWSVSQIVVADEATAKNILVQLLQGGDFAQLAQAHSTAANAADGGKLKSFITGRAPFDALQMAVANLDAGGISNVFKGPEGYYVVKVDAKSGGAIKPFIDVKKDLIYGLTLQKQQAVILSHLRDLVEKEKPEYNKDLIQQVIGKPTA